MKLSREFQDEQQALERELALKPRGTQLQRLHWRTRISHRYQRTTSTSSIGTVPGHFKT